MRAERNGGKCSENSAEIFQSDAGTRKIYDIINWTRIVKIFDRPSTTKQRKKTKKKKPIKKMTDQWKQHLVDDVRRDLARSECDIQRDDDFRGDPAMCFPPLRFESRKVYNCGWIEEGGTKPNG